MAVAEEDSEARLHTTKRHEVKDESFVVRLATLPEDFDFSEQLVSKHVVRDWWMLGARDTSHVYPNLKPGLFVGLLNGKRIGHVMIVQYGNEGGDACCYSSALFMVDKEYRGKGYGMKTTKVALDAVGKNNMCADAVQNMVQNYKRIDLQPHWTTKEYDLLPSKVLQALDGAIASDTSRLSIKPLSDVEFDKLGLVEYDAAVFGFPRREFLKLWTTIPNSLGWAVTNKNGGVCGYVVTREGMMSKDDQVVGPLFSDDLSIARLLLYTAAKGAISQKAAKSLKVLVPVEVNQDSMNLMENEIGFEGVQTLVRMYTKGVPPQVNWMKTFALTGYY